jgi:DNA-directed RNA polymerase subunit RPC12/RpoP
MKCAICGDEIKGKGKKLGDGNTVCKECYKTSMMIVRCELCGDEVLMRNAIKEDGTIHCDKCFRESVRESGVWYSWKAWKEEQEEYGEKTDVEKWAARVMRDIEDCGKEFKPSRAWMRVALEEAKKGILLAVRDERKVTVVFLRIPAGGLLE